MSDIFALSFDTLSSPSIQLSLGDASQGSHSLGWGFGWYPDGDQAAIVTKDPVARATNVATEALAEWQNFRSTVFVFKVRGAADGYTQNEMQPFSRSFAGRDLLFMHNGDLDKAKLSVLHANKSRFLEPLSSTDSELAFCYLLSMMQLSDARQLSEIQPETLLGWFAQLDQVGNADAVMTDGSTVVCYHSMQSDGEIYYQRIKPSSEHHTYQSEAATIQFNDPRDTYHTQLIFSSSPLSGDNWQTMYKGQILIARRGKIVWSNMAYKHAASDVSTIVPAQLTDDNNADPDTKLQNSPNHHYANIQQSADWVPTYRMFDVNHITEYTYSAPVEHSTHIFRLHPAADHIQEIVNASVTISAQGEEIQYDDVFGNQAMHYSINAPYTKLTIQSQCRIKIFSCPPDDHSLSLRRTSIPLVWMPWQRQMMLAYLMPPELPETQLKELIEYAMSFVERNDYQLLLTVDDINQSIYRDYDYVQGETSLNTTAFEVYSTRHGVCQDFANLFICLARLLNIPARYRVGYIYTGADYVNQIQSEASHAWVEVYLPYVGWRGYDPTNGCDVQQNHVRVACGRNYRDATPTTGTLFKGGDDETLRVDVQLQEIIS